MDIKFFISGGHFAKDPVSVWAFDYKQLVFETGFENRIQFRCNQTVALRSVNEI